MGVLSSYPGMARLKQPLIVSRSSQSLLIALQLLKLRSPNKESEKTFEIEWFICISLATTHQRQKFKLNNSSGKCCISTLNNSLITTVRFFSALRQHGPFGSTGNENVHISKLTVCLSIKHDDGGNRTTLNPSFFKKNKTFPPFKPSHECQHAGCFHLGPDKFRGPFLTGYCYSWVFTGPENRQERIDKKSKK